MQSSRAPTTTSMLRQFAAAVLDSLWSQLTWQGAAAADAFVLDVGCGPGDVTAFELLPRLPADVHVVATDPCGSMLSYAASRFDCARVCFLDLDIATRNIRNTGVWRLGPYFKIFSFFSLQWVQHQMRAMRNISQLLCPGGEAVLVLISSTGLFAIYENLSKSPMWSHYLTDYQKFLSPYQNLEKPKDQLNTYLQQAGLNVETTSETEIFYVTEDQAEVRETMVALNPFLGRIPKEKQQDYLRECEEEAFKNGSLRMQQLSGGRASYVINYKALVAHARKKKSR